MWQVSATSSQPIFDRSAGSASASTGGAGGGVLLPGELPRREAGDAGGRRQHQERHARQHRQQPQDAGDRRPGAVRRELRPDLSGQVLRRGGGDAGHDRGGGDRQQERGDLRDQRVADRQQDIGLRRLSHRHLVADDAQDQAADDVDREDQQPRDRIALHELGRTVHRAVEIGFGAGLDALVAGFVGGDEAGVQVGVDRHLLAGQRVEGEARRHFGHAPRALRHHDHVDDDEDREDEQPDDIVAADQEGAERLDDMARRRFALMPVHQHDAGRRDVQAEAEQRREQQHRREGGEVERLLRVERHHQHRDRDHDVHDEEDVEHERRDRHDHQQHEQQDRGRQRRPAHRGQQAPGIVQDRLHHAFPRLARIE